MITTKQKIQKEINKFPLIYRLIRVYQMTMVSMKRETKRIIIYILGDIFMLTGIIILMSCMCLMCAYIYNTKIFLACVFLFFIGLIIGIIGINLNVYGDYYPLKDLK